MLDYEKKTTIPPTTTNINALAEYILMLLTLRVWGDACLHGHIPSCI